MRRSIDWLKFAWAREPVIFMSCVFGFSGNLVSRGYFYSIFITHEGLKFELAESFEVDIHSTSPFVLYSTCLSGRPNLRFVQSVDEGYGQNNEVNTSCLPM